MAIQTEPTRIQIPFADSGTKNVIPDTNSTPSASQAASWTDGFPAQCSLPLSAGGIPPARADFNGILNTMSQSIRFGQEGGVWAWDATVDYGTNRVVLGSDGLLYWSVAQSGPNVGGAQNPTTDDGTYWGAVSTKTMGVNDSSSATATTDWVWNFYNNKTGGFDYYIDPANGDDANDGLTAAAPLKTLARLRDILAGCFVFRGTTNVHCAAGTYDIALFGSRMTRMSYILSSGAIVPGASASEGSALYLSGTCTFTAPVDAVRNGIISWGNGSYTFQFASGPYCIGVELGGMMVSSYSASISIAFSGACTVSRGTVAASENGSISLRGTWSWSGTAPTGKRYWCATSGGISGAGSPTAIPGTVSGSTDSSAYYS